MWRFSGLLSIAAIVLLSSQAGAQFPPSGGESSRLLACFYECKQGPMVQEEDTFQEITNLLVANPGRESQFADVLFFDGNEKPIARTELVLSPADLDELNVCHTLYRSAKIQPPPPAGLIGILVRNPRGGASGVTAWMKNVLGKFFVSVPEPFQGRVQGIAKTPCKAVPVPEVNDPDFLFAEADQLPAAEPILVEGTEDLDLPDLIPVPDPRPGIGFCVVDPATGNLIVSVRNQGTGPAGASQTVVDFGSFGSVSLGTPALNPGATWNFLVEFSFGCFNPDCDFSIKVDDGNTVGESDETNNQGAGLCLG